jgi:hypothetical protein
MRIDVLCDYIGRTPSLKQVVLKNMNWDEGNRVMASAPSIRFSSPPQIQHLECKLSTLHLFRGCRPLKLDIMPFDDYRFVGGSAVLEEALSVLKTMAPTLQELKMTSDICIEFDMPALTSLTVSLHSPREGGPEIDKEVNLV